MDSYQGGAVQPSSLSSAFCPMKITDQPLKRITSFMVDDIVRNPNNSPSYSGCFPGSTYLQSTQANQARISTKQDCEQLSARVRSSKSRSSFSVEQVLQLERVFEGQKYLGSRDIQRIAEQLQMTETQVKTWFQNRRMKMKRKQSEAAERRAKLSFLNNLACSMQPSFHGYQSYYPAPPPGAPPVLCPGLAPPECAWSCQSPLNFPPNQPAARFLSSRQSWECLAEHAIDRRAASYTERTCAIRSPSDTLVSYETKFEQNQTIASDGGY